MQIAEIAYKAGFNDLFYFNRRFRARYGATPSDIRHARGSGVEFPPLEKAQDGRSGERPP